MIFRKLKTLDTALWTSAVPQFVQIAWEKVENKGRSGWWQQVMSQGRRFTEFWCWNSVPNFVKIAQTV
jgi:hypothetical protein